MSIPDTRVYVQFDLEASSAAFFTLDDAVQGVLDGIYGLGGDTLEDVTEFVASVNINRGKSRELDRFTSGQASVIFHNDNRYFDPFYVDSPYFQQIVPKRQILITSNGVAQYSGFIEDIDLTYQLGNKSFASITCSDAFTQLAAASLDAFTNSVELSGNRINTILSRPEVNWSLTQRDIDTGQQTLQADLVAADTNVLSYLQIVELSEPGALFISKDGKVTFKDRINYPSTTPAIIFADDSTVGAVKYNDIEVIYGSENLYNSIIVTRSGGTPQTADSVFSQSVYGVQTLSQDGLLINTDENALVLANYLLDQYKEPELRFSKVGITLHDKSLAVQNSILALEINDIAQIKFRPNNIGNTISENAVITGIKHSIGIDQHKIEIEFGQITDYAFTLNDAILGVLSDGTSGYPLGFW